MNSTPSPRSSGFAVLVLGVIAVWVLLWHSRPESTATQPISGQALCPCAGPNPNSTYGNQPAAPTADVSLTTTAPVTLTREAAKVELRKHGQYETLGAAIAAARHAVEKIDPAGPHSRGAEYFAANPGQQLRAWFSNEGVELASGIPTPDDEEPWSVTLRLRGFGREGVVKPIAPGTATGEGSRVEVIHHGMAITQWFENGKDGLKQGFTLDEAPQGEAGEAIIVLEIGGDLRSEAMDERENARFVDDAGAEVLHYNGLKAWDATGRLLPARMDPRGPATLALIIADAGAHYPVTIDPLFVNVEARLTETYPIDGDHFGEPVALSGDTALVGASWENTEAGQYVGSAYVFVRIGTVWSQQARLTAADAAAGDFFGSSVALAGDTALVGAPYDNTEAGDSAGSACVFVRSGAVWNQQAKLTAGDGAASDIFGWSVAFAGDTALVGAINAGSAYVFVRDGAVWSQQEKLAGDGATYGNFGGSVALAGDTALVGAYGEGSGGKTNTGSAYVFVRNGGVWGQQAKLIDPDGAEWDSFGYSVALSGDTALVGEYGDNGEGGSYTGSAYVFVRDGTVWSQQAKITAADAAAGDSFGSSVALAGDTALVGARQDDIVAIYDDAGSAYVFVRRGAVWNQQAKLTAGVDASMSAMFGQSVALSGNAALVGETSGLPGWGRSGSAYVFRLGELPEVTQHPVSRTVVPGQSVTFSVTATGYAPLRYQWRKNGYLIDGATGTSLTIQSAQVADQGNYDCVVSNIGGVSTSAPALLAVNPLSQFAQTFPGVPPEAQGYVVVTLSPAGIGGWRFVGEQQWRASGMVAGGLVTGDRVLEFRPVPGYLQPSQETVGVVSGGAATFIDRVYYETPTTGTGGLSVIIKPDALAEAGVPQAERAQWRLLGEDDSHWRDSEATLSGLVPGSYLVECKPVAGRSTPPPGNVWVQADQTPVITLTYFLADSPVGTPPGVLPFETVATSQNLPFAYVGQIRSTAGASSGFVVKARVVATAGHVVFDDATLSTATGLEWLFERDRGTYEPKPQIPRGFYLFDSYAAQRETENTPGTSSPQSQNLDAAALYFLEDAGRGGFGGYLASDQDDNEFILSSSQKMLVGYPVDGINASYQGRMHATPPANVTFARAFGHTYATSAIRNSGGGSGGPLCVQFEGGNYYPAAIYLGGSSQTVVRSIDSQVIDLFTRAEVSGNGGDNNTGGGITHTSVTAIGSTTQPGSLKVLIEPEAARTAGAGWRLKPETAYRLSGAQKGSLSPGTYVLEFTAVSGFPAPPQQAVAVTGGQLITLTFTYGQTLTALEAWRLTYFGTTSNTDSAADNADPDGDGQPNLAEYAAGTRPNNAADLFKILTATKSATSFTVTASGKAARTYVLEKKTNLATGPWTPLGSVGPLAADGPVMLSDPAPPANTGFYRLRVSAP